MGLSYAEAVKRVERKDEMVGVQKEPEQKMNGAEQKAFWHSLPWLSIVMLKYMKSQKGLRWCWMLPGDS